MPTSPSWQERFDESGFQDQIVQLGVFRQNHSVKSFISTELSVAYERGRTEERLRVREAVENLKQGFLTISAEEYIRIVKSENYDAMFDFGVKITKEAIISLVESGLHFGSLSSGDSNTK